MLRDALSVTMQIRIRLGRMPWDLHEYYIRLVGRTGVSALTRALLWFVARTAGAKNR